MQTDTWLYSQQISGLVQDCSNSSVLAIEVQQSCIEPSKCFATVSMESNIKLVTIILTDGQRIIP